MRYFATDLQAVRRTYVTGKMQGRRTRAGSLPAGQKGADVVGVEELRDSVNGIRMREDMRRAVIENVTRRTQQPDGRQTEQEGSGKIMQNRKKSRIMKTLAAAALVVAVIGVAAVPVRALVNSLVKERMEEMPQEEKSAYVETVEEAAVAADGFSRAYTEQEKARYQELAQKYQEGVFPESALPQVKSEEEAAGYEFCYLVPEATFCLPERELTDEELLEIIDFTVKRDYAYTEAYEQEHAEEIEAKEAKEQEAIAGNVESGGITEQQAIEIAREKLADIFGMTGDGYEQNSYYNEPEEGRRAGRADYCVNWTNYISHKYYYFNIDAQDGHLISATYSGEDVHREARILTTEEAQERIPQLQIAAAEVMDSKVGVPYDKVYVYYLCYEDGSTGSHGRFYFAGSDGNAYGIGLTWDGLLFEIEEQDISGLQDGMERELWNGETYDKATVVFQEMS